MVEELEAKVEAATSGGEGDSGTQETESWSGAGVDLDQTRIDEQFSQIESRLDGFNEKLDELESRSDEVDSSVAVIEQQEFGAADHEKVERLAESRTDAVAASDLFVS